MSAFVPITLVDQASTNVEYFPSAIDPQGVAKLFEAGGAFDARRSLSLSVRLPKVGGSVARVTAKVVIPVMDGSTPPVKTGECICTMEFVIPKTASEIQREDLLLFATQLLADPGVVLAVENLESLY